MTNQHPLPWLWLIGVAIVVAIETTSVLLHLCLLLSTVVALLMAPGTRRRAWGLALISAVYWIILTLILPSPDTARVLFTRPFIEVGPGVSFGGPLTAGAASIGLVALLRCFTCILLLALLLSLVPGSSWHAVWKGLLGGGASLTAAWSYLIDMSRPSDGPLRELLPQARLRATTDPAVQPESTALRWLRLPLLLVLCLGPLLLLAFQVVPAAWVPAGSVIVLAVAVAATLLGGCLSAQGRRLQMALIPLLSAMLITGAWYARGWFPGGDTIAANPPSWSSAPLVLMFTTLTIPLSVFLEVRRAQD